MILSFFTNTMTWKMAGCLTNRLISGAMTRYCAPYVAGTLFDKRTYLLYGLKP